LWIGKINSTTTQTDREHYFRTTQQKERSATAEEVKKMSEESQEFDSDCYREQQDREMFEEDDD
jgi:hypothetical protein